MAIVYLGIGSNLGDRKANIDRALNILQEQKDIKLLALSNLIETEPVGGPEQGKFLNGAARVETDLMPLELLSRLKNIERRLGRQKGAQPNAPRPIDLDILFYDDVVIVEGKNLNIPHPRLAEREFVLQPLEEIAADFVHPRLKKSVRELRQNLHESHSESPSA